MPGFFVRSLGAGLLTPPSKRLQVSQSRTSETTRKKEARHLLDAGLLVFQRLGSSGAPGSPLPWDTLGAGSKAREQRAAVVWA
jgi:hypothetical protein